MTIEHPTHSRYHCISFSIATVLLMRTQAASHINHSSIGQTVTLSGWIHRRRDHGGLIFLDLRDRNHLVQIVCNPNEKACFERAQTLRNEYVITVEGVVHERPEGTRNPDILSGDVEIHATKLDILNQAQALPFSVDEYQEVGEEIRLKYRYIDLRRRDMQHRIRARANVTQFIRRFLDSRDFIDIETPFLTKTTPEGARDYLVPSRNYAGKFYALPQSPQIFKQLLMMSGFDRYYQIVKCFRDEDLRADRQPEFTQLDIEMAFIEEHDVQTLLEMMIRDMWKALLNVELPNPFPRMTFAEAMRRFGSDKPDLRNPLELVDIADLMKDVEFKVFNAPANDAEGRVTVLRLPKGAELSRKQIDDYTQFVGIYGAKGLAYVKVVDKEKGIDGLQSPILKFIPEPVIKEILARTHTENGDMLFFGADKAKVVSESLGALRDRLCADFKLYTKEWAPLWVTDFPMYQKDKNGRWEPLHHPFTSPTITDPEKLKENPGASLSRAYDMVLNGYEIGGGSIRIHNPELQLTSLAILGIDENEANEKFGHLINALKMGCPPHGGIAFGVDRITMLLTNTHNIRDVIAFPKTQTGHCPLTNAPSVAGFEQLRELGIKVNKG